MNILTWFCRPLLVFGFAASLLVVGPVMAQQTEPEEPAVTREEAVTEASSETESESAPGPAAAAFAQVFEQWKARLTELREMRVQYRLAEDSELPGLQAKWNDLMAQTNAMADDLEAKAIAAYEESPNEDRDLVRFLLTVASDHIKNERYQHALAIAEALLQGAAEERGINDLAGIGAFGSNQFELAEKYLQAADARGTLSQQGSNFFASVADVKTAWEEELALREAEAAADDLPRVKLETSEGDIVVELLENEAPETVGNFISLVERGFYDGLKFHRVLDGFMAQTGCPNSDGTGGPGYNIYCECVNDNHRQHFAGTLSMAKERSRNTGGSQFFITFVPTPHLNGQHTVFGRVLEGMDVLPRLQKIDPTDTKSTAEPTKIVKAEVLRKRDHEYRANKVK
jgi:cyclophilin family peptidyl-prolyl cis-trans isomerase